MITAKILRSLTMPAAVVVCLLVGACSTDPGPDDDGATATTPVDVTSTAPPSTSTGAVGGTDVSAIDTVAGTKGSDFYCGEFGNEQAPTLIAIDLATGTPAWTMCSESSIPLQLAGRADVRRSCWSRTVAVAQSSLRSTITGRRGGVVRHV